MLSERTDSRASATPWSAARNSGADGGYWGTICRLPAVVVMDDSGEVINGMISAGKRCAITHPSVKNAAMPRLIPRPTLLVVALPINRDNLGIQEPFRPFYGCSTSVGRDWRLMGDSFA